MKKKVALLLTICMVLSSLGLTFGANASDIENHWAKGTIKTWISNDFISGYPDRSFRPNNPITRAEFMVLVNKAFGFTERGEISYKDVSEGEWYYSTVARAVAAGYMGGYTDGSMKPNHPISRQEVTVVLSKITNTPENPSAIDSFTDASAIANWAKGYVGAAAAKGYMGGYPDESFKPTNNITRAEAVVTLNKALTAEVGKEEQEPAEIVYDEAGTYGPQTGRITITKDVIIKADGVTLQNKVIEGSLTIAEEVGDGEVYLNNVTVKGETFIRGGGKDSIYINGGQYNKITVQKTSSGNVRIVATNSAGLEIIISEAAAGEAIILEGSFDSITIEADDVNIVTQGETNIEEVVVKEGVKGAAISLGNDTIITKLVADARIGVEGEGTIIEASGEEVRNSTFAKDPERMITPMAPSIGGGGGGSSGGGTPSTVAVSAITVSPTTLTLTAGGATSTITATVSPENATNKNVVWLSSNPAVANVDGGVVTPVAEGTVIITATSAADGTKSATSVVTVNAAVNNEPQMTASPTQVTVESGFNQTFTLTIENDTVTNAVYTEYILLGGVFAEMNLGDIDRSNDTTVTAAVYGNLTNTGIGKITLDADALVNSESNLTVSVTVVEGTVGAITVTGNAVVGATLTAETNPDTATGSYQWQSNNNGDWVNIGTDSNTYTIDVEDVGNAIRVVFEAFGNYTGEVKSDAVGPVVPEGPNNGTDDGEFFVDAVKDKVTIVNGDGDIDGYTAHVYVDGTLVESETLSGTTDISVTVTTGEEVQVALEDTKGNVSELSAAVTVAAGPDNGTDDREFFVNAAEDKVTIVNGDGDIDGYTAHVYVDGTLVESETLSGTTDISVTVTTGEEVQVTLEDTKGNVSELSTAVTVAAGPDNGTDDGEFFVNAAEDKVTIVNGDGDIDGYTAHVYVDGTLVESETLSGTTDISVTVTTGEEVQVTLEDTKGNVSELSAAVTVAAGPTDTQADQVAIRWGGAKYKLTNVSGNHLDVGEDKKIALYFEGTVGQGDYAAVAGATLDDGVGDGKTQENGDLNDEFAHDNVGKKVAYAILDDNGNVSPLLIDRGEVTTIEAAKLDVSAPLGSGAAANLTVTFTAEISNEELNEEQLNNVFLVTSNSGLVSATNSATIDSQHSVMSITFNVTGSPTGSTEQIFVRIGAHADTNMITTTTGGHVVIPKNSSVLGKFK